MSNANKAMLLARFINCCLGMHQGANKHNPEVRQPETSATYSPCIPVKDANAQNIKGTSYDLYSYEVHPELLKLYDTFFSTLRKSAHLIQQLSPVCFGISFYVLNYMKKPESTSEIAELVSISMQLIFMSQMFPESPSTKKEIKDELEKLEKFIKDSLSGLARLLKEILEVPSAIPSSPEELFGKRIFNTKEISKFYQFLIASIKILQDDHANGAAFFALHNVFKTSDFAADGLQHAFNQCDYEYYFVGCCVHYNEPRDIKVLKLFIEHFPCKDYKMKIGKLIKSIKNKRRKLRKSIEKNPPILIFQ